MFPPEIFSEIFSFLGSEARVLVACSQAHPIFAQLIEPSLYAHVIVHDDSADDERPLKFKPSQLSTLLSDNPRILSYLRSLCVEISRFHLDNFMKQMATILPGLKLDRIHLKADRNACANWEHFPQAFRTALVGCISTYHMK